LGPGTIFCVSNAAIRFKKIGIIFKMLYLIPKPKAK
jgi:hypothetical protein